MLDAIFLLVRCLISLTRLNGDPGLLESQGHFYPGEVSNLFFDLKQQDLRTLLRARGVTIDPANRTLAPWREEWTPSVVVYRDHWHDYGDPDKHGDFFDWLELAEGLSREAARNEAAHLIGSDETVKLCWGRVKDASLPALLKYQNS